MASPLTYGIVIVVLAVVSGQTVRPQLRIDTIHFPQKLLTNYLLQVGVAHSVPGLLITQHCTPQSPNNHTLICHRYPRAHRSAQLPSTLMRSGRGATTSVASTTSTRA
jgi:hypothetical protein